MFACCVVAITIFQKGRSFEGRRREGGKGNRGGFWGRRRLCGNTIRVGRIVVTMYNCSSVNEISRIKLGRNDKGNSEEGGWGLVLVCLLHEGYGMTQEVITV